MQFIVGRLTVTAVQLQVQLSVTLRIYSRHTSFDSEAYRSAKPS